MSLFEEIKINNPEIVEQMCLAAIEAGLKIMDIYSSDNFFIETKSDDSPLTIADKTADKIINGINGF